MINYITAPFKWFFKLEAASGLMLLIAAVIALIISNSGISYIYFDILNIHFPIGFKTFVLDLSSGNNNLMVSNEPKLLESSFALTITETFKSL